jgi:hypothetical protein
MKYVNALNKSCETPSDHIFDFTWSGYKIIPNMWSELAEVRSYNTLCTTSFNFDDFHNPPYTHPLINAMPPSSTIVIEDDDTSSSAISELDSDQFTHSGDDDALSDSTPNTTCNHP